MKKIIVLGIMIMIAFTVYAEQSFKIKFHSKNGEEPLLYNIYDIQKIGFKNISDKYVMTVYFKKYSSAIYDIKYIDYIDFLNNKLNIYYLYQVHRFLLLDIDSIIFKINQNYVETVAFYNRVWMVKNLDVSTYRDGSVIRYAATEADWLDAYNKKEGAWCYYNNDSANGAIYGKLYNWYAVKSPHGLAPSRWHVASKDEWILMSSFEKYYCENYYGYIAKALAAKELWSTDSYNTCSIGNNLNANNASGFSALPGGYRGFAEFKSVNYLGFWWTSSEEYEDLSWAMTLSYTGYSLWKTTSSRYYGYSVRCVMDY